MHKFHGSLVALITPFKDGRLDEEALAKMVQWHIDNGTNAIVPAGTTGECPTLTHEEHVRVIEIVSSVAHGKIPVLVQALIILLRLFICLRQHKKLVQTDFYMLQVITIVQIRKVYTLILKWFTMRLICLSLFTISLAVQL